jgi:zinc-ribbon domain
MICENCGAEIRKEARYCPDCGMDIPEYKPLQDKYLRGENQDDEEDFLDDNEEYNHADEAHYHQEYSNGENQYQNEEYGAYEVTVSQGSVWSSVILLLIVALLIGFVMGFIFFSGKLLNIPSVP